MSEFKRNQERGELNLNHLHQSVFILRSILIENKVQIEDFLLQKDPNVDLNSEKDILCFFKDL